MMNKYLVQKCKRDEILEEWKLDEEQLKELALSYVGEVFDTKVEALANIVFINKYGDECWLPDEEYMEIKIFKLADSEKCLEELE